ncbi:hypothetical protein LTR74_017041 [Friedmanniomyces endolithicus]|nr:hypothetical protein LTR74_017041 [Friedmanniomyces endolithicus]
MAPSNAAEDTTHHTDHSTGLKIEILQSHSNFTRWYCALQICAEGRDIWNLISPLKEILTKPIRPTKLDAAAAKYNKRGAVTPEETSALQEIFRGDSNGYSLSISEFKLDQDAFKDQQERLRDARTLVLSTINPSIRFSVSHHALPADLMAALKALCKMSDDHAKSLVFQQPRASPTSATARQRAARRPPPPHAAKPSSLSPAPFEAGGGKGKGRGEGKTGRECGDDDGLRGKCERIFSEADISRRTMMMLHDAEIQSSATIIDSGANICIFNDKSLFNDFRELRMPVGTAEEDSQIEILGGGTVTLHLVVAGEETVDIVLTAVAYAPSARCNIVSASWLAEKAKLHGQWSNQHMTICHCSDGTHGRDEVIGIAPLIDGLYHLQLAQVVSTRPVDDEQAPLVMFTNQDDNDHDDAEAESDHDNAEADPDEREIDASNSDSESSVADAKGVALEMEPSGVLPLDVVEIGTMDSNPVWIWHRKMGHLGLGNMRKLLKMSTGMNLTDKQI